MAANAGSDNPLFDLNGDGVATFAFSPSGVSSDSDYLIRTILGTEYGDATLDGRVSLLDLDTLGQNFDQAGTWAQGDFSGNGNVSLLDLDILGQLFGFEAGASIAAFFRAPVTVDASPTELGALTAPSRLSSFERSTPLLAQTTLPSSKSNIDIQAMNSSLQPLVLVGPTSVCRKSLGIPAMSLQKKTS